ncbi:MAG: hypothetical protein FJ316_10000 [SAR202 cluster bacterium]|nr:hypothetical protein [SAR202 cluster bacterium]
MFPSASHSAYTERLAKRVRRYVTREPWKQTGRPATIAYLKGTAYEVATIIKWLRLAVTPGGPRAGLTLRSLTDRQLGIAVRYYLTHTTEIEEDLRQLSKLQEMPSVFPPDDREEFQQLMTEIKAEIGERP